VKAARIAIVGATGLVGETLGRVLAERRFPLVSLRAFATSRSAGATFRAGDLESRVNPIDEHGGDLGAFADVDLVFLAAGEGIARAYARELAARGVLVIDKSSAFRLDTDVPLVVPEVNASTALGHRLIANPNCSTIPLAMTLAAVDRELGLAWASVATYQSVSGAGKDAIAELHAQSTGSRSASAALPRRIAANVIPQIGSFDEAGDTTEEAKICAELRKILARPELPVSATAVRVPVEVGHSAALAFATAKPSTREQIARALAASPGIALDDERYATPLEIAGTDVVSVTRLRPDGAHANAWLCWVVCDNLRKGAATNAVQIAEIALDVAKVPA